MQQGMQTDTKCNIQHRGFRNIYHDFIQLLTIIHSVEIPSNIQYNTGLSKGGWKKKHQELRISEKFTKRF